MGFIARIKDLLRNERNVIEIESLELGGESLPLAEVINKKLYLHYITFNESGTPAFVLVTDREQPFVSNEDLYKDTHVWIFTGAGFSGPGTTMHLTEFKKGARLISAGSPTNYQTTLRKINVSYSDNVVGLTYTDYDNVTFKKDIVSRYL